MNNNKTIRFAIRSVGAVVVLVSVFLTWLSMSFILTVELSLWQMIRLALDSLQNGGQETLGPLAPAVIVTLILVVVGGIVAFVHPLGGVVPLIGAGFFLFQVESMVGATALVSYGIGLFGAILGSVLVIASVAVPKESNQPRVEAV